MFISVVIFGSYENAYRWGVKKEAQDLPFSQVSPLPELAAVYLLAQAALRNLITVKRRKVNLRMDSVIDYKDGMANVCIETLQCMLFDDRDEADRSTLHLDQLRVYPALVSYRPMQGLQSCYLEHAEKIVQRVERICAQHYIKLPKPCVDYNSLNPKDVVGWLEEILLENHISPQYIEASIRAMSAIGDFEASIVEYWVGLCLGNYLKCFEKQSINENNQESKFMITEQNLQLYFEEIERKKIDLLLREIAKRKQNQSVTLEVRQGVLC